MRIEVKELLARMLAVENLRIRYSPTATTATFDVTLRLLTLPIYAKLSEAMYDMLSAHEVGHALYTFMDKLAAAKLIDPANLGRAASYVNICEDVRIEKLIKALYPGLRIIFTNGYAEALRRDFFGDLSELHKKSLISRVNLFYKAGASIHVPFADPELPFVRAIGAANSFEEMIAACKALYDFAGETQNEDFPELEEQEPEEENDDQPSASSTRDTPSDATEPQDESDDAEATEDTPEDGEASEDESEGDAESSDATEDTDAEESGNESDDADDDNSGESSGDGEDEEESGNETGDETDTDGEPSDADDDSNGETGDTPPEPRPLDDDTQQNFEQNLNAHLDAKSDFTYASLPHVVLNRATVDYREIIRDFRAAIVSAKIDLSGKEEWFRGILQKLEPDVIFLAQQFMMRRRAAEYQRQRTDTTGDLDMNKLWQYRFANDIFATTEVTPDGKNHGLVIVVDWSGSMSGSLFDVLIQLLVLMLFCRRVQIPFEVFIFITQGNPNGGSLIPTRESVAMNDNTRLYNIFSSRMTKPEFMSMCNMIFGSFTPKGFNPALRILDPNNYGTPLGESMLISSEIVMEFRRRYNLEFVHTVFLTDGEGNSPMTVRVNMLEDPKTRRTYAPQDGNTVIPVLELMPLIVRHRTNSNMIGFYVGQPTYQMLTDANLTREQADEILSKEGVILIKSTNYNLFMVLNPAMVVPEKGDPAKILERRLKAKVFLTEFIKLVA